MNVWDHLLDKVALLPQLQALGRAAAKAPRTVAIPKSPTEAKLFATPGKQAPSLPKITATGGKAVSVGKATPTAATAPAPIPAPIPAPAAPSAPVRQPITSTGPSRADAMSIARTQNALYKKQQRTAKPAPAAPTTTPAAMQKAVHQGTLSALQADRDATAPTTGQRIQSQIGQTLMWQAPAIVGKIREHRERKRIERQASGRAPVGSIEEITAARGAMKAASEITMNKTAVAPLVAGISRMAVLPAISGLSRMISGAPKEPKVQTPQLKQANALLGYGGAAPASRPMAGQGLVPGSITPRPSPMTPSANLASPPPIRKMAFFEKFANAMCDYAPPRSKKMYKVKHGKVDHASGVDATHEFVSKRIR